MTKRIDDEAHDDQAHCSRMSLASTPDLDRTR